MANVPLKSLKFPGLSDTYTVPQIDDTLAVTGKAADAKATGDEIGALKSAIGAMNTATASDEGKALKAKTVSGGKVTEWEFGEAGGSVDPAVIEAAVDDWLDDHPEATTTVEDGSITRVKIADDVMDFVTPEMFGAVGDGETDDSEAVQDACDAGYAVYFASDKTYYLASTVTIDHDCHLFGGENTTIKTKTPSGGTVNNGFEIIGTLKKTTTLTSDYSSKGSGDNSANQFTLSDMTDIKIGDIMVISATDQYYSYSRQYYYLGGVLLISDVYNGHIYTSDTLPFDITNSENVSVKILSAPTAIIENLNFVSDLDSRGSYKYCIYLHYCKNSIVRNCNISEMDNGLMMLACVNTLVDCVNVSKSKYDNTLSGDGYGMIINSCSNTIIQRVMSICAQGCISMGGTIPNFNTRILRSNVYSECRAVGIDMHENSYNLLVEDCVLGGASIYGTAIINRCKFTKNNRVASDAATLIFRGSHNPKWAIFEVLDCQFNGVNIAIKNPVTQTPIQAYDSIVGELTVRNCNEGYISFITSADAGILSNRVNRIIIDNWKECYEFYFDGLNPIDYLSIKNSTFTNYNFITDHNASHGVVTTNIGYFDLQDNNPLQHKISLSKTTYGETLVLPENVTINLTAGSESTKFVICGANLVSDDVQDYRVGSVTGNAGGTLSRTNAGTGAPTLSIDSSGNISYTQSANNTSKYAFYPVGMFYVPVWSKISMSATLKNTGETSGASWYPFIAIVSCETGKILYRGNGTEKTATAEGVSISHTRADAYKNVVVMCYFFCNTPVAGAVSTFEGFTVSCTPTFAPAVVHPSEAYTARRLTGSGSLLSLNGVNHIMTSDATFGIKLQADYVNNPIGVIA